MSNSVWPHRRQPTRLPHPWDSPGRNTGVGCHCLLQCRNVKSESEVTQLCPTLSDPMDCSPSGSSIHGIFQARVLEWVAIAFSNAGMWKVKVKSLSCVQLLAIPWTAAHQAPPSMGFSRQEYWSGVPLPSPGCSKALVIYKEDRLLSCYIVVSVLENWVYIKTLQRYCVLMYKTVLCCENGGQFLFLIKKFFFTYMNV